VRIDGFSLDQQQGPEGGIWVLEDGGNARLLRLEPKS
jgi:hypothetical protein